MRSTGGFNSGRSTVLRVLLTRLAVIASLSLAVLLSGGPKPSCAHATRMGDFFPFDDSDESDPSGGTGGSSRRNGRHSSAGSFTRDADDAEQDEDGGRRTSGRKSADGSNAGGLGGLYLRHFSRAESGEQSVRAAFAAAQSEYCDWKRTPLATLRGEVCGKHYKVLGLRRSDPDVDRKLKRAYRSRSLALHPDKNSAVGAADAFKLVSDAYECLSDRSCKQRYDEGLQALEAGVAAWRSDARAQVRTQLSRAAAETHYYASVFARNFYEMSTSIWRSAGQVVVMDLPVGQALLAVALAMRLRFLLMVHAMSYALLLANIELAKFRNQRSGWNSSRGADDSDTTWSWTAEL